MRPGTPSARLTPTVTTPGCWSVRAATGRRSCTRGRPSTCSVPPATGPDRPGRSTRSAGSTPCSATTRRPSRTASRPSNCSGNSATGSARRRRGTASATPASDSAGTRRPSRAYRTAVALYQAFDDRYNEADSTASLGDAHYAAGDVASARTAWRHAADILDLLRHPDADKVRAKLTDTRRSGGGHDAGRPHPTKENSPTRRSEMDSVSVSRDDIDALAQALDAGTLPATELLRSLVTAIRRVSDGDEESVNRERGGRRVAAATRSTPRSPRIRRREAPLPDRRSA